MSACSRPRTPPAITPLPNRRVASSRMQVISNVSAFHSGFGLEITRIGRGMALTMLVAHWGYLTGSVLHMIDGYLASKEPPEPAADDELAEGSVTSGRTLARQSTMNQFLSASEVVHKGKKQLKAVKDAGHHTADSAMEVARKAALAAVEMSTVAVDTVSSTGRKAEEAVEEVVEEVTHAMERGVSKAYGSIRNVSNSAESPRKELKEGRDDAESVDSDNRRV